MANFFDYARWRGDLSFNKSHFNEIDNLILSEACYVDFKLGISKFPSTEKVIFHDAIEKIFEAVKKEDMVLGIIVPYSIVELVDKIKDSKRFGKLEVSNYIDIVSNRRKIQFSAMCFHLPGNIIYVAYRGTDDTIIGWQENLAMASQFPVPSQKKAVEYVNEIAKLYPEANLILGGHSKGGNLATYAAIYANDDVKNRIINVYSNDGPGLLKDRVDIKKYEAIKDKIIRIIPESSTIGLLLDPFAGETRIVKSDVHGIRQHDAFSWQIDVTSFIKCDDLKQNAKNLDNAITNMLIRLSEEEKEGLANNVHDFIVEINKTTLSEIQKDSIRLVKYINKINPKNRKLFIELIYNLIKYKQL